MPGVTIIVTPVPQAERDAPPAGGAPSVRAAVAHLAVLIVDDRLDQLLRAFRTGHPDRDRLHAVELLKCCFIILASEQRDAQFRHVMSRDGDDSNRSLGEIGTDGLGMMRQVARGLSESRTILRPRAS